MTNIILTGDKQLDRALSQFEPKFQKKGIRKATRDAAKSILSEAKRLTPVLTGKLRKSLTVRVAKQGFNGKKLPRGTLGHEVTTREGSFFSGETFYGGIIEFGTKKTRRIAPRRFLRNALYARKSTIRGQFQVTLASALEQVAREVRK
jgi:HK97 gp10 family phage protein